MKLVLVPEGAFLGTKYDYGLASLDLSIGVSSSSLTVSHHRFWGILGFIYQGMVPLMLIWIAMARYSVGAPAWLWRTQPS